MFYHIFLLQILFSYFTPLKPRYVLWSEKYGNGRSVFCRQGTDAMAGQSCLLAKNGHTKKSIRPTWRRAVVVECVAVLSDFWGSTFG